MSHCRLLSILLTILFSNQSFGQAVQLRHHPENPYIEQVKSILACNFDFIISNTTTDTFTISRLSVRLFDKQNILLQEKFLDANGTAPSISTIPAKSWNGASQQTLFNPFPEIDSAAPLKYFVFDFVFESTAGKEIKVSDTVLPLFYNQTISLQLPLKQRILVYDAHDFLSHHRRFDFEMPFIKQFGFSGNFMRYAYDFTILNSNNERYKNDGRANEDWFAFGSPVYAAGDGKVVAVSSEHPDDKQFDIPSLKNDALALCGNYVVIEHGNGIYSLYGHLKQNSVMVKKGEWVKQSKQIASIGTSGSSFFPHLHFELRTGITHSAEGLPSYFNNFHLILGSKKIEIRKGTITTGDIAENY